MAPEFGANTTNGYIHFPHDYRGRWVVFFSHPGDFTPVCTTEFMTFQSMVDDFRALNTELVGLSVDSNASHIAWIQTIHNDITFQGWKNMEITFPVVADVSGEIAQRYGMLQPSAGDTDTVRAVFIIDPRGIIRTILYYPKSVGRNITEIKRIVIALQTSDAFHVATPAEWIPGDDVVVLAFCADELGRIARFGGEIQRRAQAVGVQDLQRLGEIQLIAASSRGGIDNQHQFFHRCCSLHVVM